MLLRITSDPDTEARGLGVDHFFEVVALIEGRDLSDQIPRHVVRIGA